MMATQKRSRLVVLLLPLALCISCKPPEQTQPSFTESEVVEYPGGIAICGLEEARNVDVASMPNAVAIYPDETARKWLATANLDFWGTKIAATYPIMPS